MAKNQDVIAEARAQLDRAQAEHDREAKRLETTNREIESLTDQVKLTDPDDEKAFGRLAAARDAARGRAEALEVRLARAAAALALAKENLDSAERDARAKQLAQLDAQIAEADRAITESCGRFRDELVERIAALRQLTDAAGALDPRLWSANPRGTRWAGVSAGEALFVAAGAAGAMR